MKLGIFACEHQKWTLTFNMPLRVIKEEQVRSYCQPRPPFPHQARTFVKTFWSRGAGIAVFPPEITVFGEKFKLQIRGGFKHDNFGK